MKNIFKISLTTLGALAIFGTSSLAVTGTVNAPNGLVLRETASKTANPISTLEDKTEVEIVEKEGEWYKIKYSSQEGYLYAEYVNTNENVIEKEQENENVAENNAQILSNVKVYNLPLITSTVISTLDAEAQITVIKEISNWSYISSGEIQGWVRTYGITNQAQPEVNTETNTKPETPNEEPEEQKPLEPETSNTEQPTEEKPEETTTNYNPSNSTQTEKEATATKGYIAVESATVRKEATTDSEVVTYLIKGTSFTIKAETEEWYKIEYTDIDENIYEGYIYKPLVTI